ERKIAHCIEHLVADEFVRVAKPFKIDDAVVLANHDRVFERRTESIAARPQALDVLEKPEGPRPRDITPEGGRGDVARERLTTDRRALEIDVDLEAGTVIGPELCPGRAIVDAHRLDHANVAPLHRLRLDAGLFD